MSLINRLDAQWPVHAITASPLAEITNAHSGHVTVTCAPIGQWALL